MKRGFTLIELLVVIAIVAVLAVVVVLTLSPAELLMQGRDANRISDADTIQHALNLYVTDAALSGTLSLGAASTTYVSVPDPMATTTAGDHCEGLGLPSLPTGWNYHCAATSTYRNTDGTTGWMPVNFAGISNGNPLGQLPIDPTNATTSGLYYSYTASTTRNTYEIDYSVESSKYGSLAYSDGGDDPLTVEKGPDVTLAPKRGLDLWLDASQIAGLGDGTGVAQWNDLSGFGNNATQATPSSQPLYKVGIVNGLPIVRFDGSSSTMAMPSMQWGTAVVVAKRGASNQSLWERVVGKRGFSIANFSTTFDTFDVYYVNGAQTAVSSNWGSSFAVVSGVLTSSVLTGAATLGKGSPSFAFLNGDVAEILVWNYSLSNADRIRAQRYLGAKWGISVP